MSQLKDVYICLFTTIASKPALDNVELSFVDTVIYIQNIMKEDFDITVVEYHLSVAKSSKTFIKLIEYTCLACY